MTYNNENAMMETKKDFILPAMVEDDCISVDVSEDYEGLRLSFPRVKIPGSLRSPAMTRRTPTIPSISRA